MTVSIDFIQPNSELCGVEAVWPIPLAGAEGGRVFTVSMPAHRGGTQGGGGRVPLGGDTGWGGDTQHGAQVCASRPAAGGRPPHSETPHRPRAPPRDNLRAKNNNNQQIVINSGTGAWGQLPATRPEPLAAPGPYAWSPGAPEGLSAAVRGPRARLPPGLTHRSPQPPVPSPPVLSLLSELLEELVLVGEACAGGRGHHEDGRPPVTPAAVDGEAGTAEGLWGEARLRARFFSSSSSPPPPPLLTALPPRPPPVFPLPSPHPLGKQTNKYLNK